MDILYEYFSTVLSLYFTHISPALELPRSLLSSAYKSAYPHLSPLIDSSLQKLHESPSYVAIGVLGLVLLITLQVLNIMRRIMVWWTRIVMRLTFWGMIGLSIWVVWQRGVERTVGDAARWGGMVSDVWWREYRRWEGQSAGGQGKVGGGYGGGKGYGGNGNR